jgi:DNA sulfur modification protein DndE
MLSSIKTSEENRKIVAELTNKLGLGPENIIARIAFAYSLSAENKLDLKHIEDSKGKEYSNKVLFGDYEAYYIALICQRYQIPKNDENIAKHIKMHVDDGLMRMGNTVKQNPNLALFDLIFSLIEQGLKGL